MNTSVIFGALFLTNSKQAFFPLWHHVVLCEHEVSNLFESIQQPVTRCFMKVKIPVVAHGLEII